MIRKWSEVLQCQVIWLGYVDKKFCWWCVRSWDEIRMVYWSMRNDLEVANRLYIKRVLLALEGFLFFSLYSFSCIAKQVRLWPKPWFLSCSEIIDMNFKASCPDPDITLLSPISPTSDPARYTFSPDNLSHLFAIFHHVSQRWIMWSHRHDISTPCLVT